MLHPELARYIATILDSRSKIDRSRKAVLLSIAEYVSQTDKPKLIFICTHNSRRSHFGQIWAQTAAYYYGVPVEAYSGGTEATAFHRNSIAVLERAGFQIEVEENSNPKVSISHSSASLPMVCYSKKYDQPPNPSKDFAAIMTCSEADAECPIVYGASERIKLHYEDPKIADGKANEGETYDERCKQIAIEMFFVFSAIN